MTKHTGNSLGVDSIDAKLRMPMMGFCIGANATGTVYLMG